MGDCFSFCNKQQGRNSHNFYQNAQICCHPQPCCLRLRRPIRPWWSRLCPPTDPLPHQVQHQVRPAVPPGVRHRCRHHLHSAVPRYRHKTLSIHTQAGSPAPLLLVMTPRSSPMDTDTERETLRPNPDTEATDTPPDLSANNMLRNSARRFLTRPKDKSQDRSVSQLRSRSLMRFVE